VAAGVRRIYGSVGDSLNGLTDALRRQGKIEWTRIRHEEVAAVAAGGEAHLTGELAVCAGSCGPGNLHLINGCSTATARACRCWRSRPNAAFGTLAISFWPYIIPFVLTIEEAAAPQSSLAFMFWGEGLFVFPLMLLYTAISYGVFRGKVRSTESNY
jgi:hypothetical protein